MPKRPIPLFYLALSFLFCVSAVNPAEGDDDDKCWLERVEEAYETVMHRFESLEAKRRECEKELPSKDEVNGSLCFCYGELRSAQAELAKAADKLGQFLNRRFRLKNDRDNVHDRLSTVYSAASQFSFAVPLIIQGQRGAGEEKLCQFFQPFSADLLMKAYRAAFEKAEKKLTVQPIPGGPKTEKTMKELLVENLDFLRVKYWKPKEKEPEGEGNKNPVPAKNH